MRTNEQLTVGLKGRVVNGTVMMDEDGPEQPLVANAAVTHASVPDEAVGKQRAPEPTAQQPKVMKECQEMLNELSMYVVDNFPDRLTAYAAWSNSATSPEVAEQCRTFNISIYK